MTKRPRRVAMGVGALVVLAVLAAGVPWALWHFVGWPLPHHVPSAAQVGRALDRQGIPAQALIDALAVVVWICWASLVASLAAEIPAVAYGRRARRLPLAVAFQPLVARLLAAVVVAGLALAPRPPQAGTPAGGNALASVARHPTPALVLTSANGRVPGGAATGSSRASGPSTVAPATPPPEPLSPTTYVVHRGDTLWGIAERELGDPLRWSQIFELNLDRPQPGGATLTDPHWIDPGWTLLLPPFAPTPPAPTSPSPATTIPVVPPPASNHPAVPTPPPEPVAAPPPAPVVPNGDSQRPPADVSGLSDGTGSSTSVAPGQPVRLPSGSVVAGSFAAGVLTALSLGQLRRRHAYRYRHPAPGRDLRPAPLRPTLTHLAHVVDQEREAGGQHEGPASPHVAETPHGAPSPVDLARRGEETIGIELDKLSGFALAGPGAGDVARAILCGLVVGAGPGAAEVLLVGEAAGRLLPGAALHPAVRSAASLDAGVRLLEAERIARARRMTAAGATDAWHFRRDNPENPLPTLLVLSDPPSPEAAGRWAALAADGGRLGIAVVYLGDTPAATATLTVGERLRVTAAMPEILVAHLAGTEAFGLSAVEAVELLGALGDALGDEVETVDEAGSAEVPEPGSDASGDPGRGEGVGEDAGEPWPEPAGTGASVKRAIRVQLFGPLSVAVDGQAVADGLRSRAKMLLTWYLLRPEGAASEQAVDALWPDTPPESVLRQFWRAFGDLRSRLRGAGGEGLDVLTKSGDHYRPAAGEIACDLWDFEVALKDAAGAQDDDAAREALHHAVDLYRGELVDGTGWLWVEPTRADLHRRALDAHLRLGEIEAAAGRHDAAAAVLGRAIELDRYAEEPYRRLMTLQATIGHAGAVRETWRRLQRRLAELDLEAEQETLRLYRSLTEVPPVEAPRVRRAS